MIDDYMNKQRKMGAVLSYSNIIAKTLVLFMYTPFLLRFIGQADYGLFQITNSIMSGLGLLSMGFSSAYVKFYINYDVHNDKRDIDRLNALYLLLFMFISFISLIIGAILIFKINYLFSRSLNSHQIVLMKYLMIIMVIDVALTFISSVFDSNIIVNEQFIFQQTRQLMQTFLVPIICVPLVFIGIGVVSVSITQLLITIIFFILNVNYCRKKLNMNFDFNDLHLSLLKKLGIFSFFIFINQIVDLVNSNSSSFILGMFRSPKIVATFAIAIQIENVFIMITATLTNIFKPKVNKMVDADVNKELLTDFMIKVGRIQMTILLFLLGGFIVVGQFFIKMWAGSENIMAYWLVILMASVSIIPWSQEVGIEIQKAMNKHIFRSVLYIFFAIINIVCTTYGSIKFGLFGAVSGYLISFIFANGIAMNWYFQARMGLDMRRYWIRTIGVMVPFLVGTITGLLFGYFFAINSIVLFLVSGLLYSIVYAFVYLEFTATDFERNALIKIHSK